MLPRPAPFRVQASRAQEMVEAGDAYDSHVSLPDQEVRTGSMSAAWPISQHSLGGVMDLPDLASRQHVHHSHPLSASHHI